MRLPARPPARSRYTGISVHRRGARDDDNQLDGGRVVRTSIRLSW